jgi:hypothetical protein
VLARRVFIQLQKRDVRERRIESDELEMRALVLPALDEITTA